MMHSPAHPGHVIRDEVIEPLDLSVTRAAEILQVTRPTLSNLLNANASLTPEMAIRMELAFGPKADHLMRMQLAFDMASAREKATTLQVTKYEPDTAP